MPTQDADQTLSSSQPDEVNPSDGSGSALAPTSKRKEGPAVFHPHNPDKGKVLPLMRDGTRIGSIRLNTVPPVKHLTDDEYCGKPKGGDDE
jgi:hypothetical protein